MRPLALITSMLTGMVFVAPRCWPSQKPTTAEPQATCSLHLVPAEIQARLRSEFGSWKIQGSENLSKPAHATWADQNSPTCPGLATGLFREGKTFSYAVLLVPMDRPDAGYRFLVFSPKAGQQSYEMTAVEKSDDGGASNFFIRKVLARDFFDQASAKRFQLHATELILMVDSGEKEYETDIYFWSDGHFRHEPVDD